MVTDIPTTYIGETSRSLMERTREHWSSYRSRHKDSHLLKHQELQHGGAPPQFVMRLVGKARSALERQTREAVRIRRRGGEGAILNSKAEFNRCYIPRLRLEDKEQIEEMEQKEIEQREAEIRELDDNQKQWELLRKEEKGAERRRIVKEQGGAIIRNQGKHKKEQGTKNTKRRKFELIGKDWGEQDATQLLNKKKEQEQVEQVPLEPTMENQEPSSINHLPQEAELPCPIKSPPLKLPIIPSHPRPPPQISQTTTLSTMRVLCRGSHRCKSPPGWGTCMRVVWVRSHLGVGQ